MSWHLLKSFFSPVALKVHLQTCIVLPYSLHGENAATKQTFFMPNSKVRHDYKRMVHKRNHTFSLPPCSCRSSFAYIATLKCIPWKNPGWKI